MSAKKSHAAYGNIINISPVLKAFCDQKYSTLQCLRERREAVL
jgi:hypothetical protein